MDIAQCLKSASLQLGWGSLMFGAVCVAATVYFGFAFKRTLAQTLVIMLLLGCLTALLLGSLYLNCVLPVPPGAR